MTEQQRMVRLGDLAHARSGDKGNSANIGVVANDDVSFRWLRIISRRLRSPRISIR